MAIKEILQGRKLQSNLTPIARMGAPVRSWQSRAADMMQEPDNSLGLLGSKGNWVSGLASAVKSGLGFYGAMKDMENQKAYNENLAQMAEQERQDKLAQAQADSDFRERELAQKRDLAQMSLDADKERAALAREQALQDMATKRAQAIEDRNAQYAHEQSMYDRNRANAIADRQAEAEAKAYAQYLSDMNAQAAKNLTAEDYAKWRENPSAYDIDGRGWWGRKLGVRSSLIPKVTSANFGVQGETVQDDPLGFIPATGLNKL